MVNHHRMEHMVLSDHVMHMFIPVMHMFIPSPQTPQSLSSCIPFLPILIYYQCMGHGVLGWGNNASISPFTFELDPQATSSCNPLTSFINSAWNKVFWDHVLHICIPSLHTPQLPSSCTPLISFISGAWNKVF